MSALFPAFVNGVQTWKPKRDEVGHQLLVICAIRGQRELRRVPISEHLVLFSERWEIV